MKREMTTRLVLRSFGSLDDRVRRSAPVASSLHGEEDDRRDGDEDRDADPPKPRPRL
ncbi:MAG TPA: hypothetical protein VJ204_17060 [Solirubrobacterales bacterium]|nr:hypothetical protein [Solirubrobacterales bacterium]